MVYVITKDVFYVKYIQFTWFFSKKKVFILCLHYLKVFSQNHLIYKFYRSVVCLPTTSERASKMKKYRWSIYVYTFISKNNSNFRFVFIYFIKIVIYLFESIFLLFIHNIRNLLRFHQYIDLIIKYLSKYFDKFDYYSNFCFFC